MQYQLTLIELQILQIQAAAKEYDAPWLKNGKTVNRNASGQFAKKGGEEDSGNEKEEESSSKGILAQLKKVQDSANQSTKYLDNIVKKLDKKSKDFVNTKLQGLSSELHEVEEVLGKNSKDFQKEFARQTKKIQNNVSSSLEESLKNIKKATQPYLEQLSKDMKLDDPDAVAVEAAVIASSVALGTIAGGISLGLSLGVLATSGLILSSEIAKKRKEQKNQANY